MTFDNILNSLDQSDREALESITERHPDLKRGWMRQDDYSRKLDDFRAKENSFTEVANFADSWKRWGDENWDTENNCTKAETNLKRRIQELESKEPDMTFSDIDKYVTDKGLAKQSDIDAFFSQKESEFVNNLKGSTYVAAKLAEKASEHYAEFKQPFKATEFMSKFQEFGTSDIDKAYDMYVGTSRKERDELRLKDKIKEAEEQAFAKGREEARQQYLKDATGGSHLPISDDNSEVGGLQRRLQGLGNNDEIPAGMSAAAFAAQKYREESTASK